MLKDTLNKGISTPIAIGIVLILVIIVATFAWLQYGEMWRETSELPEIELPEKEEITKIKITDSLLTKDKEVCSPYSDDGTPYCFSPEISNNFPLTWYNRKCPNNENESPEKIVIYDTTTETKPPGGKARITYYCSDFNKFWVYDYDSEKVPMYYWYGPFDGYPTK